VVEAVAVAAVVVREYLLQEEQEAREWVCFFRLP
jgi:hypothetical protein